MSVSTVSISGGTAVTSAVASLGISTSTQMSITVGYNAAALNQGYSNVFLGYQTAQYSRYGNGLIAIGFAAAPMTSGNHSVYVGGQTAVNVGSGSANVTVGAQSAASLVAGGSNVIVGTFADAFGDASGGVAVGHRSKVGSNSVAIGAGAVAYGRGCMAVGGGVTASNDGDFNLVGRIRGYVALSNVSQANLALATYAVQVDADVLKLGGGGALAFCADRASNAAPVWAAQLAGSNLEIRSQNGAVVRFLDDFRPGLLDFTATHRCVLEAPEDVDDLGIGLPGRVVVATGRYDSSAGGEGHVSADEAVPVVELSSRAQDPRAFGTLSAHPAPGWRLGPLEFEPPTPTTTVTGDIRRVLVNSAGEGGIWVSDEGGPIRNGDLVTTGSRLRGVATRQEQPWVGAHTAAKVTCDCDFGAVAPGPVREVVGLRVCLLGCTYRF
jgi:hypothetical protein